MTTAENLRFPVLAITCEGFAYTVRDAARLQTARARAVKAGMFEKLRVIDETGALYRVALVSDRRVAPGEWLRWILGNPRVRVRLALEKERVLTLEEVKGELRQGIRKLAHIHDEALGGVKDLLSQVDRATTLRQLLDAFVGYV